jgi:hypothetical protein
MVLTDVQHLTVAGARGVGGACTGDGVEVGGGVGGLTL